MFKEPKEKSCIQCNKTFITLSPKQKCCSKSCTKQHWKAEVNSLGKLKYSSVGRKKGITPWNKSKKCPNISGKNNGFYNHHHSEETKLKIKERVLKTKQRNKTFNTSKPEQLVKEELNKKFNFVYHQYKFPILSICLRLLYQRFRFVHRMQLSLDTWKLQSQSLWVI